MIVVVAIDRGGQPEGQGARHSPVGQKGKRGLKARTKAGSSLT